MKEFSEIFKALRAKSKSTQQEIADCLGVTARSVRFYETGQRHPDFEGLIKLADYFDVSIDYLVGRSPNPKYDRWEQATLFALMNWKGATHV